MVTPALRAGDPDREAVAQLLSQQHLNGRLDNAEFEQRLERCLAARTYAELAALTADLPIQRAATPSTEHERATMSSMWLRRVTHRLAVFVAVLVFVIWALTAANHESGTAFWPAWVWLGLGIAVGWPAAFRWAKRRPPGPRRQRTVLWTMAGTVETTLIVIWVLSSAIRGAAHYFWPVWPLLAFLAVSIARAIVAPPKSRSALAAQVEDLDRTRREAVDAQAVELGRIERDLHDGAQARLVALSMQLGRAELALEHQPQAQRLVQDAREEASRAISDLRDLSRGIAPPLLSDRGLAAAVRALADRQGAIVHATPSLEHRRLAPALERGAYFVIAEALTNAAKHAGAEHVHVELALLPSHLRVLVSDDGSGGANPEGSGLAGLRTRVQSLGGALEVTSVPRQGTSLEARFPIAS